MQEILTFKDIAVAYVLELLIGARMKVIMEFSGNVPFLTLSCDLVISQAVGK